MSNFRTIVTTSESINKIGYESGLLLIGSCFSNNIGDKLVNLKFSTIVNPFGVLYNPVSIANSIDILINNKLLLEHICHIILNMCNCNLKISSLIY